MLSVLCAQIKASNNRIQAARFGYLFGLGFFLSTLYWIAFAPMVYVDEFWWAIPFALFGLPAFLALFIGIQSVMIWQFRNHYFYHFFFCVIWIFTEWVMSWIFTGLPWALIGYAFSISDILIQSASVVGIFGLSFVAVYIGASFYSKNLLLTRVTISLILCVIMILFGYDRLKSNPTVFSEIKIRIVQPSVPQSAKWTPGEFWLNLDKHIELSLRDGDPDIIVWSEAALTVPYYHKSVNDILMSVFTKNNQILLFGGVNDNGMKDENFEGYSSLIALNSDGNLLFDYHKSHLVPFGEYMPYTDYLPLKKLTPGVIDYTPGSRKVVYLKQFNLNVQPLVCYESIFGEEVRISNTKADIIINVTNDAWYGKSSGPYQHFEISRIRSVENGLPMIRSANNGISAIIDPVGRILARLELNQIDIIDSFIPLKLSLTTIYSTNGHSILAFGIFLVLIMQLLIVLFCKKLH